MAEAVVAAAAVPSSSSSSSSSSSPESLSKDQLQELYVQCLTSALDQASSTFFADHPNLTPDTQKAFVSEWCETQKRSPYRPNITSNGGGGGGTTTPTTGGKVIEKGSGKKKVRAYIDGCYDIMHSGHYNAIRQAKSLCDELIVGVHSNEEIEHHKGPPVMNDEERLATVRACKWVDGVVFGVPYEPSLALMDELGCDFCVHGDDDATTADGKDAFAEAKAAGRMAIVKRTEGVSTTDLVKRLLAMTKSHHAPITPALASSPLLLPVKTASASSNATPTESNTPSVPDFSLPPAHSTPTKPPTNPSSAAAAAAAHPISVPSPSPQPSLNSPSSSSSSSSNHSNSGSSMSNFLPTTWRISQFANHRVPKSSDKVVYIAGSFDLFHLGHIERLEQAKKQGTFLYVGVYDDHSVNQYKGRNYPIMNIHERVLNVLSCKFVDEVVIGAPFEINRELIKNLNIGVVARALPSEAARARKLMAE